MKILDTLAGIKSVNNTKDLASSMITLFIFFLVIAYLFGSINSAILVCKLKGLPDPRTIGSGNAGATNILRIAGKEAAIMVLVGDVLKGFIPVILAALFGLRFMSLGLVAVAALLGHIYPVFFGFQGGKGVATALGGILAISFWLGIIALLVWIIVVAITRYVSVASLAAALVAVLLSPWLTGNISYFIPIAIMALLIFWGHQDNLQRLRDGTESKIDLNAFKK